MRVKGIIWALVIVLAILFGFWAWDRVSSRDTELRLGGEESGDSLSALDGRVLVWSTTANVPFSIRFGEGRYSFFELLGVPRQYRPFDISIGRAPVRNEWNVASLTLSSDGRLPIVRYLTEQQGTYLYENISADGGYVVATREDENTQNLFRFRLSDGSRGPVAFSRSLDRWPSCNRDGSRILFHSYRDGNPGGDLYLAVEDENAPDGWDIVRLTDSPDIEYVWPRIAADGAACVAVERNVGEDAGRLVLWRMYGNSLGESEYLTDYPDDARFPSLNAAGDIVCWEGISDIGYRLFLRDAGTGSRMIDNPDLRKIQNANLVQPTISPDGRFVSFVIDREEYHEDSICIYDIERDSCIFFQGCDGSVMFPALSGPVEGSN